MKKRLALLNLVLVALIVLAGARIRQNWMEARKRERVVLGQEVKPLPPPPYARLAPPPALPASDYIEIAEQMLFSPERNPNVVVEIEPPKPMPALPVLYGLLDLGDGPIAIMSEKDGARHQEVRPGQTVGQFKLVSANARELVLEWDGKEVSKRPEELRPRGSQAAAQPARPAPAPAPAAGQAATVISPATEAAPGKEMGAGIRACLPGDTSPPGTVSGGYRKVVTASPFGQICRWVPVK